MSKTTGTISGDIEKFGPRPFPSSRLQFYSLAAAFTAIVIPSAVFLSKVSNDLTDRQISLAQQHSKTIRDCMLAQSQDTCVRAFPDRVALECKMVPTTTSSVSMVPAFTTAWGWTAQRGRGMTVSVDDVNSQKLVCN